MREKTCCVTGHRYIPEEKAPEISDKLLVEIGNAIGDGYTHFISGFAEGIDLLFAQEVLGWKGQRDDLQLIAALPYRDRLKSPNPMFRELIEQCDEIYIISDQKTRDCYHARNRWMVDASSRVIAAYDGRSGGGTAYTLQYAKAKMREIRAIQL